MLVSQVPLPVFIVGSDGCPFYKPPPLYLDKSFQTICIGMRAVKSQRLIRNLPIITVKFVSPESVAHLTTGKT